MSDSWEFIWLYGNSAELYLWCSVLVGIIIGSGIFASPGVVLLKAGSVGLGITAWLVAAFIALCSALVSAELGAAIPQAGGNAEFLKARTESLLSFLSSSAMYSNTSPGFHWKAGNLLRVDDEFERPWSRRNAGTGSSLSQLVASFDLAATLTLSVASKNNTGWLWELLTRSVLSELVGYFSCAIKWWKSRSVFHSFFFFLMTLEVLLGGLYSDCYWCWCGIFFQVAFGDAWAFAFIWTMFFVLTNGSLAIVAITFSRYFVAGVSRLSALSWFAVMVASNRSVSTQLFCRRYSTHT